MTGGEGVDDRHTLGVHGVVRAVAKNAAQFLGRVFEVAKPVAHVGNDAVEVDDRQRSFVVGRRHAAPSSGVEKRRQWTSQAWASSATTSSRRL